MKKYLGTYTKYVLCLLLALFVISPIQIFAQDLKPAGMVLAKLTHDNDTVSDDSLALDESHPKIHAAIDVHKRHTDRLIVDDDVVGTAVGVDNLGRPSIMIFLKNSRAARYLPDNYEGIPVVTHIAGAIKAMATTSNTAKYPLPVPIGVSTGNIGECSAGTIGARVRDNTNVYALSNNHVYALENNAYIGSTIVQPGLYDTNCSSTGNNNIGTLSKFVSINFTGGYNTVDAAIAVSSTSLLGKATPSGGYGIPNSKTASAKVGLHVQKYGRSTSLTKGTITGINATIKVDYGASGTAIFTNQITVNSSRAFILPGDSGSLLVTDNSNANPVGLLFAGNDTGRFAVANPIGNVLSSLSVTIDGK